MHDCTHTQLCYFCVASNDRLSISDDDDILYTLSLVPRPFKRGKERPGDYFMRVHKIGILDTIVNCS